MSSSTQLTTYHSYRTVKMEGSEQLTDSDEQSGSGVIDPAHRFLYLQVQSDLGTPLPTALFTKEVITGMCVTQYGVSAFTTIGLGSLKSLKGTVKTVK